MPSAAEVQAQLFRLVYVARCIGMKRAISAIALNPTLNFWRLILGSQLDAAVLEWCKIFGSHNEATHWKQIVPASDHDSFRQALLTELKISDDQWAAYWKEMKTYRDDLVAHHFGETSIARYPDLSIALASAGFHYRYVLQELGREGKRRYPDDLIAYYFAFEAQAKKIAEAALRATEGFNEEVQ